MARSWPRPPGAGSSACGTRPPASSARPGRCRRPITSTSPSTPAADAAAVEKWITGLGSARFPVCEQAAGELAKVADQVRPRLKKVLETETSAEVRERVKKLLDAADGGTPEARRSRRAVEALEAIGTPEARRLVDALATGAEHARLTDEAAGAIGRMKR